MSNGQKIVAWRFTMPSGSPAPGYVSCWHRYPDESIPYHEARGQTIEYAYTKAEPDPLLAEMAAALEWAMARLHEPTPSVREKCVPYATNWDAASTALSAYRERTKP